MTKHLGLLSLRSPFLDNSKIYPPLANLYLKSFVETKTSIPVRVLDDDYSVDDLSWTKQYSHIGLSIMTPQREEAWKLARSIRKEHPTSILIAGGPHVKHYLDDMVRQNSSERLFNHLVPGDGEKVLVNILTDRPSTLIPSNDMSKEDILRAPRPDRTSPNAKEVLARYTYTLNGRNSTTMLTARGCVERCSYCEDAETSVRWSGLQSLREQMDDIKELGYHGVYLFDDLFAIAMPKVRPIVNELSKRDLQFRCNGQARYFTQWGEDFAKLLSDHGCVEIAFGFETGSQELLDRVGKRTLVQQNYDSVKFARKYGIKVKGFLMLGLPGETWETIQETENFIRDSGLSDFQLSILHPYKGTRIRQEMDAGIETGLTLLVPEVSGAYGVKGGETVYETRTKELSSDDLRKARDYLVRKYKPTSHSPAWSNSEDKFFNTHEVSETEYTGGEV